MARLRPADRRPIEIIRLVTYLLDLVTHQLSTTDVEVTCDLATDLPSVAGDSDQLSHVLLNLFINAQQAMLETPAPRPLAIATAYLAPKAAAKGAAGGRARKIGRASGGERLCTYG